MRTYEEWCTIHMGDSLVNLETMRDLGFIKDNMGPCGPDWGRALLDVIRQRREAGELPERYKPSPFWKAEEDEEEDLAGRVEIVKCGGKGQTVRIVHPVERHVRDDA